MYKIISKELILKEHTENNSISFIPTDPANVDYQEYLRWQQAQQQSEVSAGVIEEPAVVIVEPAPAPAVKQSAPQPAPEPEVQPVSEPESP